MTLNFAPPGPDRELKPRIVVVGVGGAGGNAVNNMIGANLEGVEFIVANTDAQALNQSRAERKIQLGANLTQGLGAGAQPEIGRAAAEEALEEMMDHLNGAHMVFITAGMGGGTGTGAAPVIAEAARDSGILTVGVITKPFHFEGQQRMRLAETGIDELQSFVDTLIIIPNQNLFRLANEKTTFADAFRMADNVLYSGVRGVTDLMIMPGLINLDFADIRTVMGEMGKAMMGTGEADGDQRAILAAESAISNPLLEDVSMRGAHGVLINITGGPDMTLFEVDEAANRIREEVEADANIIFGSTFDESLEGKMRVSVVATGIESEAGAQHQPAARPSRTYRAPQQVHQPVAAAAAVAPSAEPVADEAPSADADVLTLDIEQEAVATADMQAPEAVKEEAPKLFEEPEPQPAVAPSAATADPAPRLEEAADPRLPEVTPPRDAFIPPPPVTVNRSRHDRDPEVDPFGAADLANGGGQPARKSRTNLFRRVTKVLNPKQTGATESLEERQAAPTAAPGNGPPQPAARPATAPAQQSQPAAQQSLGAPSPDERLQPSKAEEEMLEIPAFLRRQAN